MKRKSSLADAVHGAAGRTVSTPRRRPERQSAVGTFKPRSRVRSKASGTKGVLLRLPVELHRELRLLAVNEDTSLQQLGLEALEMLLASRSRP